MFDGDDPALSLWIEGIEGRDQRIRKVSRGSEMVVS